MLCMQSHNKRDVNTYAHKRLLKSYVCLHTMAGPMDMTRGALTHTSEAYPGAYLADRGVRYVTVAGTALEGVLSIALRVMNLLPS
jgi:hypothetical protein